MIPILQVRKLSPRKIKQFVKGHTAHKWQDKVKTQAYLILELTSKYHTHTLLCIHDHSFIHSEPTSS